MSHRTGEWTQTATRTPGAKQRMNLPWAQQSIKWGSICRSRTRVSSCSVQGSGWINLNIRTSFITINCPMEAHPPGIMSVFPDQHFLKKIHAQLSNPAFFPKVCLRTGPSVAQVFSLPCLQMPLVDKNSHGILLPQKLSSISWWHSWCCCFLNLPLRLHLPLLSGRG